MIRFERRYFLFCLWRYLCLISETEPSVSSELLIKTARDCNVYTPCLCHTLLVQRLVIMEGDNDPESDVKESICPLVNVSSMEAQDRGRHRTMEHLTLLTEDGSSILRKSFKSTLSKYLSRMDWTKKSIFDHTRLSVPPGTLVALTRETQILWGDWTSTEDSVPLNWT